MSAAVTEKAEVVVDEAEPGDAGRRSPVCLNCGSGRVEEFCPECGQENLDPLVPVQMILKDAAEDLLKFDSRLLATLRPLLLRPGFLTAEYLAGRRAPYIAPMKLFLIVSALYIFVFTLTGMDRDVKQAFAVPVRTTAPAAAARDPSPSAAERRRQLAARQQKLQAQLERVGAWYTDNISLLNLALLPAYAFTLWVLYRRRRLFVECFVCTLYGQSAMYLLLLPLLAFRAHSNTMAVVTLVVHPVYSYLSLRTAFDRPAGVSRAKTALRAALWFCGQFLLPVLLGIVIAVAYLVLPDVLGRAAAAPSVPPPPAR
jgi:hypothetical protein